ncbi:MAG: hypothetical protein HYX72_05440 [Acidobacteria bacterium]|nr:hypothetical protein [Acidobacteriota bacterium]
MPTAMASSTIVLPLTNTSEAQRLIAAELTAIRELAELSGDPGTLLLLDLLETQNDESAVSLTITLQISATLAAAAGLAKRQWMQQLLNRHATDEERVQTLWRTLVEMHSSGDLPWAA